MSTRHSLSGHFRRLEVASGRRDRDGLDGSPAKPQNLQRRGVDHDHVGSSYQPTGLGRTLLTGRQVAGS